MFKAVRKIQQRLRGLLAPALLIGGSMLMIFAGYSAYQDTTSLDGSSISTGSVDISSNATGSSAFLITDLLPGDATIYKCIKVTNVGNTNLHAVDLYAAVTEKDQAGVDDPALTLAGALNLKVSLGTGDALNGSCTDFVASAGGEDISDGALGDLNVDSPFTDAVSIDNPGWTVGTGKTYRLAISLPEDADGASAGHTVTASFSWTAK